DVRRDLQHDLRDDDLLGRWRSLLPADDHAADEQDADEDRNANGHGTWPGDLEDAEEQIDHRGVEDRHGTDHEATPSLCGGRAGIWMNAQMKASGQRTPPATRPIQPAAVTASACGWPRRRAILPGNEPSATTSANTARGNTPNTTNAAMLNGSSMGFSFRG